MRGVGQEQSAMLCSILLRDHEGKHLVTGAAPSLPDFYNAAINVLSRTLKQTEADGQER